MKLDQVFDVQKPQRLHRRDCKHIGAGGNSNATRSATPRERRTLPKCHDCARTADRERR